MVSSILELTGKVAIGGDIPIIAILFAQRVIEDELSCYLVTGVFPTVAGVGVGVAGRRIDAFPVGMRRNEMSAK